MKTQDKEILLKDLCARLPYGVKFATKYESHKNNIYELIAVNKHCETVETFGTIWWNIEDIKPYLRPMSSMTEEEAKTLVTLWGIEDFISLDITEEYIGVVCDDGFNSTVTTEIWYDGDMSIECFDFLNTRHLDYRGLIPIGLALEAPKDMYDFK
jgi:hypothetical protein